MKILAIEKEVEGALWNDCDALLQQEAHHVFQLYLADCLREIYFTETNGAVLILECSDAEAANRLLAELPLVQSGKITFEVMQLKPYTGYKRIIQS